MKESEAKTKWCPMAKAVPDSPHYASGNRFENDLNSPLDNKCKCIASDCMIWEPEYELIEKYIPYVVVSGVVEVPDGWHNLLRLNVDTTVIGKYVENGSGDCGLKTKELQRNV